MITVLIMKLNMKTKAVYRRGRGKRRISAQRRTTMRIKEREARRLAERRAKRRAKIAERIREQQQDSEKWE